ncbi:MAG TPA: hypothetical protein VKN82_08285 [Desulfohalobiaceae bacterium]|nr:hypothetical protein [Desulfohalobiaceae bacterium]
MRKIFYHFLVLILFVLIMGCSEDNHPSELEMLETKCFTCHSRLIVCKNLDQGHEYWKNTVKRMVKKGMEIDPQSEMLIIDFLQGQGSDLSILCK